MKTILALAFTLIVSVSIPCPVFAAPTPRSKSIPVTLGGFSLTPTIGGYLFAGLEQRDATQSYGLKIGYESIATSMADSLGIEGTFNYFTTRSKAAASDPTGYLFRLDAIYPFVLGGKWMPFLAVGGGAIIIDTVSQTDKSPLFNYGAGLKYFLEDYLAMRVDARHLIVYNNADTHNNFEIGIGMSYYFGKERKKKPVQPPVIEQKKKEDVNNGEKKSAVKSATSPPLIPSIALAPILALESAVKPLFQAEASNESTGKKPDVATPVILASPGVPKMNPSPAGTIPTTVNAVERKPEHAPPLPATAAKTQPAPAKTEKPVRQAVRKKVVRKLTVEFDINSSYIKPEFYKKLSEIADIMKSSTGASARIEGHSDSTGKLRQNIKLSEQRAQSIQSRLIKLSVDSGRISTIGYGPSEPIGDNATIKGKQKNRRAVTLVTLTVSE